MKLPITINADRLGRNNIKISVPAAPGGADEFDLQKEMQFGDFSDHSALEEHGPKESWWGALLADQIYAEAFWKETAYDVYMAHLRTYAAYCLRGQGIRRGDYTKQDIHDTIVRMFSETTQEIVRNELAQSAFLGYMQEKLGSRVQVMDLHRRDPEEYGRQFTSFYQSMYVFQQQQDPVWLEQAIQRRLILERSRSLVEAVVSAFKSRGHLLRQAAENEKARRNMLGISIDEIVERVAEKLGGTKAEANDSDTWVRDRNV